jgi:hypothetical protein
MTPKRNIEKRIERLEAQLSNDTGLDITITKTLVIKRERAEREGREILGPAEGTVEPGYLTSSRP